MTRQPGGVGRIVTPPIVLDETPQHIHAKSIHAPPEPESQYIVHGGAHLAVTPVEVRLLLQEGMVIILPGALVEFPRTATEVAQPVVGLATIRCRIAP